MINTSPESAESKMRSAAIAIEHVTRHFGAICAVDDVSLTIHKGELFGLIGHNGAGKSTLFKMMLGLIPISKGNIDIHGFSTVSSDFRVVKRHIGYLPENVVLYDNLTGLETLEFYARLKNVALNTCADALERVGLTYAAKRRVRGYSKGMRQRLGFAQALLGNPRILFLDEPTTGLDPEGIRSFYVILRELQTQGVTIVITSHILAEIQERVDRLAIMSNGKIQACGTVTSLREEMALPMRFDIRLRSHHEASIAALRTQLASYERIKLEQTGSHEQWRIECPYANKMAVFAILQSLGDELVDLYVREPSLEDLFFGRSS